MDVRRVFALAAVLFILPISTAFADVYEVIDMAKNGVSEDVMLAYVENRDDTYDLDADDIKYLYDVGVPDKVVVAMIERPAEVSTVALVKDEAHQNLRDYSTVMDPPDGEPDISYFYTALAPYGTWIKTEAYGHAWQPYHTRTIVNWAPYRDAGRWVYTEEA